MNSRRVWTSEGRGVERETIPPEVVRRVSAMWAQHRDGATWAQVGQWIGMPGSGADVEMAFNELLIRAMYTPGDPLLSVEVAYMEHYEGCEDCQGPDHPDVILGTRAPGPGVLRE